MNSVHRFVSNDFTVRVAAVDSTAVVRELQTIQDLFPLPTVAVGRAMTGALLMASHLKQGQQVGILVRGVGPMGSVYAEASFEGHVRGYTPHAEYQPENYDKGLSLKDSIGQGTMTVARHLPFQKEPYQGTVQLVSSEIASDIAHYLHQSHQIRSIVNIGVFLDEKGKVVSAGGVILEVMPGVEDDVVDLIHKNAEQNQPNISTLLKNGARPIDLAKPYMQGLDITQLDHPYEIKYHCPCTKDRVMQALEILGQDELKDMVDKNEEAKIQCQMCGRPYLITPPEIEEIRQQLYKNSLN